MKRTLLVVLVVVFAGMFFGHRNNDPRIVLGDLLKDSKRPWRGELTYKIYLFTVIPVAEAVFAREKTEELQGRKVYHLQASAATLKTFSWLFKGSATFDSYIDPADSAPLLFRQKINAGNKGVSEKEVAYDQKAGVMTIAGVKRQIPFGTQDPLSAIYNIRKMNLSRAKNLEMNLNTNQKNYLLAASLEENDRFVFVKAQISRRDKNPYHKSNLDMVLCKDAENLPLLIKVFASGCAITAKLVDIK